MKTGHPGFGRNELAVCTKLKMEFKLLKQVGYIYRIDIAHCKRERQAGRRTLHRPRNPRARAIFNHLAHRRDQQKSSVGASACHIGAHDTAAFKLNREHDARKNLTFRSIGKTCEESIHIWQKLKALTLYFPALPSSQLHRCQ